MQAVQETKSLRECIITDECYYCNWENPDKIPKSLYSNYGFTYVNYWLTSILMKGLSDAEIEILLILIKDFSKDYNANNITK